MKGGPPFRRVDIKRMDLKRVDQIRVDKGWTTLPKGGSNKGGQRSFFDFFSIKISFSKKNLIFFPENI